MNKEIAGFLFQRTRTLSDSIDIVVNHAWEELSKLLLENPPDKPVAYPLNSFTIWWDSKGGNHRIKKKGITWHQ